MILDRIYIGNDVYTSFDLKIYQLVFEHNQTSTNCFKDDEEAKNSSIPNKFSILYDLSSTKYLMKDNFRYFIIEYPELKLINVWKQTISPTEELERSGLTTATRFTPIITQTPMDGWGGLVKTTYGEDNVHVPTSYLNGVPANQLWHYCIGILCTAPQIYLTEGMPAIYGVSTKRVSLWCALRDSRNYFNFVKHSCICSIYSSLAYQFMAIVICS